jgi:hypothetical protein
MKQYEAGVLQKQVLSSSNNAQARGSLLVSYPRLSVPCDIIPSPPPCVENQPAVTTFYWSSLVTCGLWLVACGLV